MRHVAPWLAFWVSLFWLWLLLVGQWDREEIVASAIAATVAASVGEAARSAARVGVRVPLRRLAEAWTVPHQTFVDFGILMWALGACLVHRRVVRGRFVRRRFPVRDPAGTRAWIGLIATYSPNAYVVDFDGEDGVVLMHDLVPHEPSERPVA